MSSKSQSHPGARLRKFREAVKMSLREAARQLHVQHPTVKDWEERSKVPMAAYRSAIEVWTGGTIRAEEWPLSVRERGIVESAGRVEPARVPNAGRALGGQRAAS